MKRNGSGRRVAVGPAATPSWCVWKRIPRRIRKVSRAAVRISRSC